MKKCKTCKHWQHETLNLGKCSGIIASSKVIPIPNQPKEKPDGKLIATEGIIVHAPYVLTNENWNCKNWRIK